MTREHRLYQTDFLIRQYGFSRDDMLFDEAGKLSLTDDPKKTWADAHPEFFPLNVKKAERWQLLRVPGLGPITVSRIIKARRESGVPDLAAVKVTGKRAMLAASYLEFS